MRQEHVVAEIGVRRDREAGDSGRTKKWFHLITAYFKFIALFYPTRIGPSQEDSHTGHQRGESGNTRDDGTPNRLPRDPKSGYLVRDLSQLQAGKALTLSILVFVIHCLWFTALGFSDSRDMPRLFFR